LEFYCWKYTTEDSRNFFDIFKYLCTERTKYLLKYFELYKYGSGNKVFKRKWNGKLKLHLKAFVKTLTIFIYDETLRSHIKRMVFVEVLKNLAIDIHNKNHFVESSK